MDLRRVVPLALRATGNDHYIQHSDQIVADIAAGQPIHVAFAGSRAFPIEFLDALEVAEESGSLVESMGRLSNRYEEEAESAVRTLATIFGFAVGLLVMGIIVLMIFRLAGFYLGTINSLLDNKK
jgi:type IV pilus assembly protein PilC